MYVDYYRQSLSNPSTTERRKFSDADYKRAGFRQGFLSGMPVLEAHQTVNRLNTQEAKRKGGPRFVHFLPEQARIQFKTNITEEIYG